MRHPFGLPANADAWRALDDTTIAGWIAWLEQQGVFFSYQLDLDMMMVQAFPQAYGDVSGLSAANPLDDYREAVFGKSGAGIASYPAGLAPSQLQLAQYEALFKKGSKPVAHVEALSRMEAESIRASCPQPLVRLFDRCRRELTVLPETVGEEEANA